MSLHVVQHPLLSSKLTLLRQVWADSKQFRALVKDISSILAIEASKGLPTKKVDGLQSPFQTFSGEELADRIGLVPILRAGLGMTDALLDLFPPQTVVQHIGLFREKFTLQPVEYYSKLPAQPNVDTVFILDPLIATGGTAIACVKMINEWGIPFDKIHFLCILGSRKGVEHVLAECPDIQLWVGAVDETLSDAGYILPGLGDSGDRLFNNLT